MKKTLSTRSRFRRTFGVTSPDYMSMHGLSARELGLVVATAGPYEVIELCEKYSDGWDEVIGHHVRGPGCDPNRIYDLDDALAKLATLTSGAHRNEHATCPACGCGFRLHVGKMHFTVPRLLHANAGREGPVRDPIVHVLDDDPSLRRAVARLLASAGFTCTTHAEPAAFFDCHDPRTPGCLILDLALPGTSGLAVQQKMRTLGMDLPVIFLSGCAAVPESVRAMKDGAVDFLTKPVDSDALLDAVRRGVAVDNAGRARVAEDYALAAALDTLTPREREMLPYLVAGRLNKQVANDFGVVEKTVKVHRGRVMFKFGTRSLADLVRITERLHIEPKGGRFSAPSMTGDF